jgi:hypothetical protein
VSSLNVETFEEFSSEIDAAQPYLVFYQKHAQVVPSSPLHSKVDLLIEALHSIRLLSDEADRSEALRNSRKGTLAYEIYQLLAAGLESYKDYCEALSSKEILTRLMQDWAIQDSSQAYNIVLQQLNQSEPMALLVDKLKLTIAEQTGCRCMGSPVSKDWSDECFSLPLYIEEAYWSIADQIKKQLVGVLSSCPNGARQCYATHAKSFKAVPNILTLQMNYRENVRSYKPLEHFAIKHKNFPTKKSYRLVRAVYNFEDKAVSYYKQGTSKHFKVFSELSIEVSKKSPFPAIQDRPCLLFYKREGKAIKEKSTCKCLVF